VGPPEQGGSNSAELLSESPCNRLVAIAGKLVGIADHANHGVDRGRLGECCDGARDDGSTREEAVLLRIPLLLARLVRPRRRWRFGSWVLRVSWVPSTGIGTRKQQRERARATRDATARHADDLSRFVETVCLCCSAKTD
jgi:hypothetical protein